MGATPLVLDGVVGVRVESVLLDGEWGDVRDGVGVRRLEFMG